MCIDPFWTYKLSIEFETRAGRTRMFQPTLHHLLQAMMCLKQIGAMFSNAASSYSNFTGSTDVQV
jgi:hypothetical protein